MGEDKRPRRRWRLGRVAAVLGATLAVGLVLGVGTSWWSYQRYVVEEPGPHLDEDHIRSIIAQESPVYYRDGTTRVGVFFEDEHRQFVPFDDLPLSYTMSIVAAEDVRFWTHRGIDGVGIARAMWSNIAAGGLVAGGSTLTQQTAKNLYYRPDRSLRSKGTEALNALRLEQHYRKDEILTFYVNQFHVSGNGRGLGIAARYFFDAEVEDLDLVQAAFLAGLVKGPANYDPFIGDTDRRARATERAYDRTRYVLRRLVEVDAEQLVGPHPGPGVTRAMWAERVVEGRRLQAEAQRLLDEGFTLPFQRGTFRYDSSAVLDEVARRLAEPPFADVLAAADIDDPATAGLKVVTTLDPDVQRESLYSLWHHLTEVGLLMEGGGPEGLVLADQRGPRFDPDNPPGLHEFHLARVSEHLNDGHKHLRVDLGGTACTVDRDAIIRVAVADHRHDVGDKTARAPTSKVDAFRDGLPVGSVVRVSVREVGADGERWCDLERRPELQGAAIVLEQGEIRAVVGGNDNRNFNRATAPRQLGSTFKPLVYHSAIQLGWSPDDLLDNRRAVFPWSTTFYYPRPDHSPEPVVSMAWAGVHSENLATIWLLYHLTDRLDGQQVRVLAHSLGLARRPDESEADYRLRIQRAGVLPTRRRVEEGLFLQSRQEVVAILKDPDERLHLSSLLYGWGYGAERRRVEPAKVARLDRSWGVLRERIEPCRDQYDALSEALKDRTLPTVERIPDLWVLPDDDGVRVACGGEREGWVRPDDSLIELVSPPEVEVSRNLWEKVLGRASAEPEGPGLDPAEDMWVDEELTLGTLEQVRAGVERRHVAHRLAGDEAPDLYDPEVLYWHQDFRVLLGLRYVQELAASYGVQSDLQTVLSLPLGASEITLEEAASLYTGLTTGERWTFPGRAGGARIESPPAPTLLIAELRDVDDNVLYRATPVSEEVVPPSVGAQTSHILRNVVRWGTGRRASSAATVEGLPVPLGGKTGTTNDFRNAAFLGYAPRADGREYSVADGYVVGVYVGYDDNRPMTSGRIRLAGSSGALPAWIGITQGLAADGHLGEPRNPPEGAVEWPTDWGRGLREVTVDSRMGLPLDEPFDGEPVDAALASILVASEAEPELDFEPVTRPVRVAPKDRPPASLWELP